MTLDIEEEKREHNLVIEATKDLKGDRKCWRLIGGVLVEKTIDEVNASLKSSIELLEKTSINFTNTLKEKEK